MYLGGVGERQEKGRIAHLDSTMLCYVYDADLRLASTVLKEALVLWPLNLSLSLCLLPFLSVTHTHTHHLGLRW